VGGYREEEAPYLYGRVGQTQLLTLARFTPDEMARLSEAMLGETGRRPQVLSFLEQQTEGNVFFMVEVLRTLAESGNPLNEIGLHPLPKQVANPRIVSMIQQRITHLPPSYHELLRLAAVLGRGIDVQLLAAYDPERADQWLIESVQAGIVHLQNDDWEFSHDKIRTYLLAQIPPPENRYWQRQAATLLERVYPQQVEYAARIAEHWRSAGEPARAFPYYQMAGKQARALGATDQARQHFEQCIALATTENTAQHLEILSLLVGIYQSLNQFTAALRCAEQYWRLSQQPFPQARLGVGWQIAVYTLRQLRHELFPAPPPPPAPDTRLEEQLELLQMMAELYGWSGQPTAAALALLRSLVLADQAGYQAGQLRIYVWLSYILWLVPLPRLAQRYWQRYHALKATTTQPPTTHLPEGLIHLHHMRWTAAQTQFESGYAQYAAQGNLPATLQLLLSRAYVANLHQDEVLRQLATAQVRAAAQQSHNAQFIGWSYVLQAIEQVRRAAYSKALQNLYTALQLSGNIADEMLSERIASLMALNYAYLNDPLTARLWLEKYQQQAHRRGVTGFGVIESVSFALEAYLHLYQHASEPTVRSEIVQGIRTCLARLRLYTRVFPLAQPFEHFWRRQAQAIYGKPATPAELNAVQREIETAGLALYFADITRRCPPPA
jgi:hypothetical protein